MLFVMHPIKKKTQYKHYFLNTKYISKYFGLPQNCQQYEYDTDDHFSWTVIVSRRSLHDKVSIWLRPDRPGLK